MTTTLERPTVNITDSEGLTRQFEHVVGRSVGEFIAGSDLKVPEEGQVAYVDGTPLGLDTALDPGVDVQIGGEPING